MTVPILSRRSANAMQSRVPMSTTPTMGGTSFTPSLPCSQSSDFRADGAGGNAGCGGRRKKDDQALDGSCSVACLRSRGAQITLGAAKERTSGRLDQRRELRGSTHEARPRRLRAEMLAWRRFGGTPGMETPTSRLRGGRGSHYL